MTDRGRELLATANEDPAAVTAETVQAAVRSVSPQEVPAMMRGIGIAINADETRTSELLEVLVAESSANDRETRLAATRGLVIMGIAAPDVLVDDLSVVLDRLDDEFAPIRAAAVRALGWLALDHLDAVLEHVDQLPPRLHDTNPYVGKATLDLLSRLADTEPVALVPIIEPLIDSLRDPPAFDDETTREWIRLHPDHEWEGQDPAKRDDRAGFLGVAASVVGPIAVERPEAMAPHVSDLITVIEREDLPAVRFRLLDAVQAVAETDPEAAAPALAVIAELFRTTENRLVREQAGWTLTWLAAGDIDGTGDELLGSLATIESCLESDRAEDRGAALGMLSYLAEREPEALAGVLPMVREAVDAGDPQHRGMAIWTLAYAGDGEDRERLHQCKRGDPNEHVRDAAGEALAVLEDRLGGPENGT